MVALLVSPLTGGVDDRIDVGSGEVRRAIRLRPDLPWDYGDVS